MQQAELSWTIESPIAKPKHLIKLFSELTSTENQVPRESNTLEEMEAEVKFTVNE